LNGFDPSPKCLSYQNSQASAFALGSAFALALGSASALAFALALRTTSLDVSPQKG